MMNSKAIPWLLFSYFLALALPIGAFLPIFAIFPIAVFEGLFFAIMREYCDFKKSIALFSVYNIISLFAVMFQGDAAWLFYITPWSIYVLPIIGLIFGYWNAFFWGYFFKRWLHKSNILQRLAIRNGD